MARNAFFPHTSPLNSEGCPTDPRAPVPPPWDSPPMGAGPAAPAPVASPKQVSEIGAMLAKWARNPALKPYEELFRAEPNEAWFDVVRDPDHTTQFEIATVQPGGGQSIILMDYEIIPYTFSSVSALDYAPLEDGEISGSFGYSLTVNGMSPGPLRYRLQPIPTTIRNQSVRFGQSKLQTAQQLTADDFTIAQANDFASSAQYGTGLHPQTSKHYGPRSVPFTEFIHDDGVFAIQGVVFQPVAIPLAFIEARISGFRCPAALGRAIERDLADSLR